MNDNDELIKNAVHEAQVLEQFKKFCDTISSDSKSQHDIRNIIYRSTNKENTVYQLFKTRLGIKVNQEDLSFMLELITAFLNKRSYRTPIPLDVRESLLKAQGGRCAFCGNPVDQHDAVDHIVPFKYVGDELRNNYQILCKRCNSSKKESMDYQIKVLLSI